MTKIYDRALIIGKFYPFHKGHEFLIRSAEKRSKRLTVIICQTDRYKIPVEVRSEWLKKSFPGIEVKVFHHDASLDSTSTEISKTWADLTLDFLGYSPDVVFSSENYGRTYASYMGSEHVLVDIDRKHFPVSATQIRENIDKYWDFLPEVTKSYFRKRIVVLGAESTGTTTLSQDLARHFQTNWVPEYGRTYYEGKMYSRDSAKWTTDEFVHIARSQNILEDALLQSSGKFLICDTDAFATTLWHERYRGSKSSKVSKVVKNEKPLLYIVTDVDIPFVQDGTRDGEHLRKWMHQRFIEELVSHKLEYLVVSGSRENRLQEALRKIESTYATFLRQVLS